MGPIDQSESAVLVMVSIIVVVALVYQVLRWLRGSPTSADPWSEEVEKSMNAPEAEPVCHRCFSPHGDETWFCPCCGAAVGDYNNWMPYVYLFSQGEVLRNGVTANIKPSPSVVAGYIVLSLVCYLIFAPVYWYFLFKNLQRIKQEQAGQEIVPEV